MKGRITKTDQQPGLPMVGRIKVGEKRKTADGSKEYPTSLDYFRPDSKYNQKFYAWIRVAQIEMDKDDIVIGEITGQVRLGDDTEGLYRETDLKTYIVNEHSRRFSQPDQEQP